MEDYFTGHSSETAFLAPKFVRQHRKAQAFGYGPDKNAYDSAEDSYDPWHRDSGIRQNNPGSPDSTTMSTRMTVDMD